MPAGWLEEKKCKNKGYIWPKAFYFVSGGKEKPNMENINIEYWRPITTLSGPCLDKINLEMENNLLNLNPSKTGAAHCEVWGDAAKLYAWLKAGILTWLI